MGSYFLKILLLVFLCLAHANISILGFNSPSQSSYVKCRERERQALLNFKQSVRDYYGILSTWRDDENYRDCCRWEGIECNNVTGHVQVLDLRGSIMHSLIGPFNLTLLVDLQKLEYLDLSSHPDISGSQIPEQMGSFKNLRYLNLSYSYFIWGIPSQLGNLPKLEYLDLQGNFLNGVILSKLENLSKLKYLDLKGTGLGGTIPSELGKLTRLQYLDLSGNYNLQGEIPYQLGNLSHLSYLDLGENSFSGAIPFQVGNLRLLHTLRLDCSYGLKIKDENWLFSLSSLRTLSLTSFPDFGSSCHMINELIPNLRELRLVNCSLSDNDISFLFRSDSNFSTSLIILDLSHNILTSSALQLLFNSSSKLQELHLNHCSLIDRSFLMSSASNKMSLPSLFTLHLSSNLLKSPAIFHWIFNYTANLRSLDLSDNLFESPIPSGFGEVINTLEYLDLSRNKLQGEFPSSLGNICTLQSLSLSSNNFSGELPCFIQNSSLQTLDLSFNQITGMPLNLSVFTSLRYLDLSNSQLTGEIPKSIGLLYELKYLSQKDNYFKGEINELHLTNLSKLIHLDLTDNSLSLKFATTWLPPFQLLSLGL